MSECRTKQRHRVFYVAVLLQLVLWAVPASGQIQGTVTDINNRPIPAILVELWAAEELLGQTLTNSAGQFTFSPEQATGASGLSLGMIGYRTMIRRITPEESPLRLTMEALPVPLPELTVLVARRVCPNEEEPRAGEIWRATRARYAHTTGSRGFAYWAWTVTQSVPPSEVGHGLQRSPMLFSRASNGAQEIWGGLGGAGVFRRELLEDELSGSGYAVRNGPKQRYLLAQDFYEWFYPALGAHHAYHFVSELFGRLHTLSLIGETDDTYRLAFCPIGKRPAIEGTLTVGKDSTLHAANWSFRTPEPVEEAGGEAIFAPWTETGEGLPHLLPVRSVFWRRIAGRKLFHQRSAAFICWIVSPDTTAPVLPRRPPAESRCLIARH